MRVTNNTMIGNMMRNLQRNMKNLDKLNEQLSSGKQFRFPSQAPIQTARSMDFNSQLNNVDQFKKNVDQANSWMETTESALTDANEVLHRARELTIYGANDTLTETERENIATEVEQLKQELLAITETKHGDRYVFGGQQTGEKPFDDKGNYLGDNRRLMREINPGVEMAVNTTGEEGFADAIDAMDNLLSDLRDGSAYLNKELGPGKLSESILPDNVDPDDQLSMNVVIDGELFQVDEFEGQPITGETTRQDLVEAINNKANEALGTTEETYARIHEGNLELRSMSTGPDSEVGFRFNEFDFASPDQTANQFVDTIEISEYDNLDWSDLDQAEQNDITIERDGDDLNVIINATDNNGDTIAETYEYDDFVDDTGNLNFDEHGINFRVTAHRFEEMADGDSLTFDLNEESDDGDAISTFNLLDDFATEKGGDGSLRLSTEDIGKFDKAINSNVTTRAEIGAKMNRLDLTQSRLEDQEINLRSLKSENEDVDIAETIMELRMQESVYQASLASGARVMQPTLLDFLR